jgi:hypothetical protein
LYYPYLRGKRFEALALRSEANALAQAANVLPIVEPVKNEWRNLQRALDAGLALAIITNPRVGDYSPPPNGARRAQLEMPPVSAEVYGHANAIPTMLIDDATTAARVQRFARTHQGRLGLVVVGSPTANPDPLQAALGINPHFVGIRRRIVPVFAPRQMNVAIEDNFMRQDTNSLYPHDEFFTNMHVAVRNDGDYAHFGDYSIQGDHYRDGGGRANNVALHHVYTVGPNPSDLRVRHYVSTAHRDVAVMWYAALSQLVADLAVLARRSALNSTSVLAEYRALHHSRAFPGLGKMKELALRQHLLLMTVVQ